jgi:hypothetical protein
MKLPGFEAEASLCTSGQAYRGTPQGISGVAAVVPALSSCQEGVWGQQAFARCNAGDSISYVTLYARWGWESVSARVPRAAAGAAAGQISAAHPAQAAAAAEDA